jgi:hypothetical protein
MPSAIYADEDREADPEAFFAADADEAMRDLYATLDALAALADRHAGDSGADAALIEGWAERAEKLCEEIRATLGEPRVLRHGVLVPVGYVAAHTGRKS